MPPTLSVVDNGWTCLPWTEGKSPNIINISTIYRHSIGSKVPTDIQTVQKIQIHTFLIVFPILYILISFCYFITLRTPIPSPQQRTRLTHVSRTELALPQPSPPSCPLRNMSTNQSPHPSGTLLPVSFRTQAVDSETQHLQPGCSSSSPFKVPIGDYQEGPHNQTKDKLFVTTKCIF